MGAGSTATYVDLYLDDVLIVDNAIGEYKFEYYITDAIKYQPGKRLQSLKKADGTEVSLQDIIWQGGEYVVKVYGVWEYTRVNIDGQILQDIADATRLVFDEDSSVTYKPQEIAEKLLKYKE